MHCIQLLHMAISIPCKDLARRWYRRILLLVWYIQTRAGIADFVGATAILVDVVVLLVVDFGRLSRSLVVVVLVVVVLVLLFLVVVVVAAVVFLVLVVALRVVSTVV